MYDIDGIKTPPYENIEELMEMRKENLDLDIILSDFDSLSRTREYINDFPMYIKYQEIKSFIDLNQSKIFSIYEELSYDDISNIISMIVEVDKFFVDKKRQTISEERTKK